MFNDHLHDSTSNVERARKAVKFTICFVKRIKFSVLAREISIFPRDIKCTCVANDVLPSFLYFFTNFYLPLTCAKKIKTRRSSKRYFHVNSFKRQSTKSSIHGYFRDEPRWPTVNRCKRTKLSCSTRMYI